MKTYKFKVYLSGTGENPDEAWRDACDSFSLDPGTTPVEKDITELENEKED